MRCIFFDFDQTQNILFPPLKIRFMCYMFSTPLAQLSMNISKSSFCKIHRKLVPLAHLEGSFLKLCLYIILDFQVIILAY